MNFIISFWSFACSQHQFFCPLCFPQKDPNHKARNDGSFEKAFIIFSEHKDLPFGIISTYFLPKLRLHLFIDIVLQ